MTDKYTKDDLLKLISKVEAANGGKTVNVVGTEKAIRDLEVDVDVPVIVVPDFILSDDEVFIIPSDVKPIKYVIEYEE